MLLDLPPLSCTVPPPLSRTVPRYTLVPVLFLVIRMAMAFGQSVWVQDCYWGMLVLRRGNGFVSVQSIYRVGLMRAFSVQLSAGQKKLGLHKPSSNWIPKPSRDHSWMLSPSNRQSILLLDIEYNLPL